MIMDDDDGQIIFGDLVGLKLPDICLTDEENPGKNLTQEPGPLSDRSACYRLFHSGGSKFILLTEIQYIFGHYNQ